MILEDENNIYLMFYFLHVFVRELIIISMLAVIQEILQISTPFNISSAFHRTPTNSNEVTKG